MAREVGAAPWPSNHEEVTSWRHSARGLFVKMNSPMMLRFTIWCAFVLLLTEGCLKRCRSMSVPVGADRASKSVRSVVGKYATYDETIAWYNKLANENRGLVKLINIGNSYEGRSQIVMRISPMPIDIRPAIFIEGGMHAREWLSPSTANYLIDQMIKGYNGGYGWYRYALRKYVFYFMSITNPDGYMFTFDTSNPENRFWRKNRRRNANGCFGVDLNRNFDIGDFYGSGTSSNPCEEIYHGTRAFSEPETLNMKRFAESRLQRKGLQLYISLHTYMQMWVVPFSYRSQRPQPASVDNELHRAALAAARATRNATGAVYEVQNGARAFGVTTSGSDDWMLAKMNARYSYTLELRPSHRQVVDSHWKEGFQQPSSQIIPTGKDALAALKELVNTMRSVRGRRSGV